MGGSRMEGMTRRTCITLGTVPVIAAAAAYATGESGVLPGGPATAVPRRRAGPGGPPAAPPSQRPTRHAHGRQGPLLRRPRARQEDGADLRVQPRAGGVAEGDGEPGGAAELLRAA